MNACLLISSAIDTHASKDKHQIALWNGCEEHVVPNYMAGLTIILNQFFFGFTIFVHIKLFPFEKSPFTKKKKGENISIYSF